MKNIKVFFILILFVLWCLYLINNSNNSITEIRQKGCYYLANILAKPRGGRGGAYYLKYKYCVSKKVIIDEDFVTTRKFHNHDVGDTILIQSAIIKDHRNSIVIFENYNSCMGKQPPNGWKELPKCE